MPTLKQKRTFYKTLENGGNVSKAMSETGYSKAMIKNPQKLTESLGWIELTKEYLPDHELLQVHRDGLYATKIHSSLTEPDKIEDDWMARAKYLDMAYKVKGSYNEKSPVTINVNVEELRLTIQQQLESFRNNNSRETVLPQSTETV
jgi:hypothetical protein